MPRFRQITDILKLMSQKEYIRNLGIIAHIDHGKTTLTDSLLAGAGLLSPTMAGSARVLDYLEEEQRRGITIKTANISLLYQTPDHAFIINLVDTPGHVDFTGKVTRALRIIDGAVVVVDAVEELMAQTEVVTQQALQERVRPVLFINKVDRLITELRMTAEQIQEKFTHIITNFNNLIEIYGEPEFKSQWKVNPAKDSVAFGSALHGWSFTVGIAKQKGVKFSDIIEAYNKAEHGKLRTSLPLHSAILDMAVKNLPSPSKAQKYRVEKIWKGNINSKVGHAMTKCDDEGPTVMFITNVQANPAAGVTATGRVFSGTIKNQDKVHLVNVEAEGVVEQVSIYMGAFKEDVDQISAGNLATVTGLEQARAGETLVDINHKEGIVPFERIHYVQEPVVTVAVEPKNPVDLPLLLAALNRIATEDPNLATVVDRETGEYLLSSMGELHLEISVKQLKNYMDKAEIVTSPPRVVYRETVTKNGTVVTAKSPNKLNAFSMQVVPLNEERIRQIEQEEKEKREKGKEGNLVAVDEYKNMLVDYTETKQLREVLDAVISGFTFACKAGPLCGEPIRHVEAKLMKIQLSENAELRNSTEVMRGVGKAIFASFLTAKPILLEPVYKTVISTPTELAGECSRIVESRHGKINAFEQRNALTVITSSIPVIETFGLSEELRSTTSGRAFWQSSFDHWERITQKLAAKTITEVRKRKGLPAEVPKPEKFLETEET